MSSPVRRVFAALLCLTVLIQLVGQSGIQRASAWSWESTYDQRLLGLVSLRDTNAGPGAECVYNIAAGTLKVRVTNPSYIKLPPANRWATGRVPDKAKLTITTSIGRITDDKFAKKSSSWTVAGSAAKVEIGGTRVLDNVMWGSEYFTQTPELTGTTAQYLKVFVSVSFKAIDHDSALNGRSLSDSYTMDYYKTTVVQPGGATTSTVNDGYCYPPYQPRITLGDSTLRYGSTMNYSLAGYPAGSNVRLILEARFLDDRSPTSLTVARVTVDGTGAAQGVFTVPTSLGVYFGKIRAVTAGKLYSLVRMSEAESMRPVPRSGARGSTVTFSFAGCRSGPYYTASVYWKKGSTWVRVANKPGGHGARVDATGKVPSWAPYGVNQLRYQCSIDYPEDGPHETSPYPDGFFEETFRVTSAAASSAEDATATATMTAVATETSVPTATATPEATVTDVPAETIVPTTEPTATLVVTVEPTATETETLVTEPTVTETATPEPTATEVPAPELPVVEEGSPPAVDVT